MPEKLTHVNVWVHDQDEALTFYTEKLGLELRDDVTIPEMGGYRYLTVGPPAQPDVHLILSLPAPPIFAPDDVETVRALVAKGSMLAVTFTTDDCRGNFERLRARGVEFSEEPTEQPFGVSSAARDLSGNLIRFIEPR